MQLLIIFAGLCVMALGVYKHVKNISIGYEVVRVPGVLIAALGVFIVLLGILYP